MFVSCAMFDYFFTILIERGGWMFKEYIQQAPVTHQAHLEQIYQVLKAELPDAEEKFAYGMPTFKGHKNLVHFADNKQHLGFYPGAEVIQVFSAKLKDYRYSKGAIQFPFSKPLDVTLIQQMVRLRKELDEK